MAAAKALGADVVVASDHEQVLAGDDGERALAVYLRRPELAADAIVEFAGETPLDAIVPVDDKGVVVAAIASDRLGLASNPPSAASAARNKLEMRRALRSVGVRQPEFRVLYPTSDAAEAASEVGWPVVIKPVGLAASQGVIRADDAASAVATAARVRAIVADADEDPEQPLLVEEFVPGVEVAVEALLDDGHMDVLAVFDKPDPLDGPYFEETLYVTPSRLPAATLARVEQTARAAAAGLGLREGPVHAELRVRGDEPYILEVAARSIGGLCARSLRFGLGVSLEELILRHALRLPIHDTRLTHPASGVMMLPIPRAGVLREVRGLDAAGAAPGIAGVEITIASGRSVRPLPEGHRYLGFLFARGASATEVERALRSAADILEIVIEEP